MPLAATVSDIFVVTEQVVRSNFVFQRRTFTIRRNMFFSICKKNSRHKVELQTRKYTEKNIHRGVEDSRNTLLRHVMFSS